MSPHPNLTLALPFTAWGVGQPGGGAAWGSIGGGAAWGSIGGGAAWGVA